MKKKLSPVEEAAAEARLSAAIVRDVIKRHLDSDVDILTKDCLCGYCQTTLACGKPAIFIKNFERKKSARIHLCDRDCLDGHEAAEISFFGCKELEKIPTFNHGQKIMNKDDLLMGYHDRLLVAKQNAVDSIVALRKKYQMDNALAD